MSSVILTSKQKLEFNINWLESHRLKLDLLRKDIQREFVAVRARLNSLNFDSEWQDLWQSWRPKRNISHMIDSVMFFLQADLFLKSKMTEMRLLLKANIDPEAIDPAEIAQHQVNHQHCLEKLESISASDCEELLANLEQGMMMLSEDGQAFEVNYLPIACIPNMHYICCTYIYLYITYIFCIINTS